MPDLNENIATKARAVAPKSEPAAVKMEVEEPCLAQAVVVKAAAVCEAGAADCTAMQTVAQSPDAIAKQHWYSRDVLGWGPGLVRIRGASYFVHKLCD